MEDDEDALAHRDYDEKEACRRCTMKTYIIVLGLALLITIVNICLFSAFYTIMQQRQRENDDDWVFPVFTEAIADDGADDDYAPSWLWLY